MQLFSKHLKKDKTAKISVKKTPVANIGQARTNVSALRHDIDLPIARMRLRNGNCINDS